MILAVIVFAALLIARRGGDSSQDGRVSQAMAQMGRTMAEQSREWTRMMDEVYSKHRAEMNAMSAKERHWNLVEALETHLRQRGLMSHIEDPESRVNREIQAWQEALKCSRQEAADAILNRVKMPEKADGRANSHHRQ